VRKYDGIDAFDGDEMNTFMSQSTQTMSELMDLAAVPFMVLAPRDGTPVIEVVQDTMVGSFRLTKDWVRIHDKTLANLQMVNSYFHGEMPDLSKKSRHYTGKQAFSQILPPSFYINMKNKADEKVVIKDSQLISGTIDKPVFHSISRGIIPVLFHDYGPFEVRRFLDNLQRLVCRWLMSSGFSVGISDLVVDQATQEKLKETIHVMKANAYKKIEEVRKGNLVNNSIFQNDDFFEREIINILNNTTKDIGKIGLEQIDERTNRMINMVKSGSKGKDINVSQMIGCVGQQNVDGKRVAYGFTDRTLPHFNKFDDGPEARGFVENSFISGLTPQEVFFHAMGGREGLIDTAVKSVTRETEILIVEDGNPKVVAIGDWIDQHMERSKHRVQYKEEKHTELLELDTMVYIPDVDSNGHMKWNPMKYVTRHDPDNELYEVTTQGGRKVIVTQYDSMLVWNPDKQQFLPKPTTDIKVGEFVPVTSKLPAPPITLEHVDVSKYLPKTEFLYGSDFWTASRIMEESMDGREHIHPGWWDAHNGKEFTLPYPSKARLQRVVVRSDVDAIKEGCIYNFAAQRGVCSIPDRFILDNEFGTFIGLYLAEGCCHIKSGKVSISNSDPKVKEFVKRWFQKYNIKTWEETRPLEIKNAHSCVVSTGTTCSIEGNSTILARFLDKFVGHGAQHKFVPHEAYAAPEEFIVGLLNGYFAGDGYVGSNDITVSSASEKLINGIALLCNRFGAFGKISKSQVETNNLGTPNILPSFRLNIRSRFAERLRAKVDFIIDFKNERLKNLKCSMSHRNFPEENDVVMDAVQSIRAVDVSVHPKVYDVTVPGTYNFMISSGLCLRDTSETGYIQRRLVKAMEDCKIYYDQTVRNATGVIVQFLYGEDGMDGTKMENQYISTIGMNMFDLDMNYHIRPEDNFQLHLTEAAWKEMQRDGAASLKRCEAHYESLLDDRQFLIEKVFRGDKIDKITFPIPFERLINSALMRSEAAGTYGLPTDLTPKYVLDNIDELINKLKIGDEKQGTRFLHLLVRLHLSPKPLIIKHHMSRAVFDWVVSEIHRYFLQAIAQAGEMVGIIAAQTMGENSTQLVLDSFHSSGTVAAVKATSGVPRFKELLSVSKNIKTPILMIYLQRDIGTVVNPVEDGDGKVIDARFQETKEKAIKVKNSLEITRIVDILDTTEIFWDSPGEDGLRSGITADDDMLEAYRAFTEIESTKCRSDSPWLLRMKLNKDKMYRLGLTMLDIYIKIHNVYGNLIDCTFSDDNASELIFRVRVTEAGLKDIDSEDAVAALKAIEHNLIHNVILKGVKGIKKVSMHPKNSSQYNQDTGAFDKVSEWVLDTDGTNLQEIFANPNVDPYRTRSNDVWEIYHTLGIEAARNALYNEIMDVIGEGALNYRHVSLLLDTMTNRGQLMSIDRHGINRGDVGPLAKSSFEETTDMLINASIFSEYDKINGVSANIMLGQLPPCGTGDSEIILDEERYVQLLREVSKKEMKVPLTAELEPIIEEGVNDPCGYEQLAFQYTVPDKHHKKLPQTKVSFV
jgi:DNA-directed RNA polymerase beta' subunit/intein/homing endonuclease